MLHRNAIPMVHGLLIATLAIGAPKLLSFMESPVSYEVFESDSTLLRTSEVQSNYKRIEAIRRHLDKWHVSLRSLRLSLSAYLDSSVLKRLMSQANISRTLTWLWLTINAPSRVTTSEGNLVSSDDSEGLINNLSIKSEWMKISPLDCCTSKLLPALQGLVLTGHLVNDTLSNSSIIQLLSARCRYGLKLARMHSAAIPDELLNSPTTGSEWKDCANPGAQVI